MSANILAQYANITIARKLLRRGMRISTIGLITDLPCRMIGKIHYELFETPAPAGRRKSTSAILSNIHRRSEASIFVAIYLSFGGDPVWTEFDIEEFIHSYDAHCATMASFHQEQEININYAWALARDLRSGTLTQRRCHRCKVKYLYLVTEPHTQCPICPTITDIADKRRTRRLPDAGGKPANSRRV